MTNMKVPYTSSAQVKWLKYPIIEVYEDYCSSRLVHRNILTVRHHIKGTWLH